MTRSLFGVAGVVTGLWMLMGVALAGHNEPAKASNKATFGLVTGYIHCDTPNTATLAGGAPACAPAVPLSPCAFGPAGVGKLTIARIGDVSAGTQDLALTATAKGLVNCEGANFHIRLYYRLTTDDCPEGSCTVGDFVFNDTYLDLQSAFCVVSQGKCTIKTTLSTAAPGLIANGKNAGIAILGCGLKESFALPNPPELQCGVLLK